MKVIVVYDTPWGEQCDKRWLYEGLSQKYECELVVPSRVLSRFGYEGIKGKLKGYAWNIKLALRATHRAKAGDVIVVWQRSAGMFTSALARGGVTVVSLNWLTPSRSEFLFALAPKALGRSETWAGVNSPATKSQLGEVYGVEDLSRVFLIPDVPAEGIPEFRTKHLTGRRYCFTGGLNNRDWPLVIEGARRREGIAFECVAKSDDWSAKTAGLQIPDNVTARFDTPADEYYGLLEGAYCMLLPLCDDRVAGLINILKAICWGVIPLFSRNTAMEQYLPEDLRDVLQFEVGDADDMLAKLDAVWALSEEEYASVVGRLQAHIAANFTSDRAIACIDEVIQKATVRSAEAVVVS